MNRLSILSAALFTCFAFQACNDDSVSSNTESSLIAEDPSVVEYDTIDGDMLFPKSTSTDVSGILAKQTLASVRKYNTTLWNPGDTIKFYDMYRDPGCPSCDMFTADQYDIFFRVLSELGRITNLNFKMVWNLNDPYTVRLMVLPTVSGQSWAGEATVGKRTLAALSLHTTNVSYKVIMHEMLHILGFSHEHQRYDRDNYITVDPAYLTDFNYELINSAQGQSYNNYDFASIMHYQFGPGSHISRKVLSANQGEHVGELPFMSSNDYNTLKTVYGSSTKSKTASIKLYNLETKQYLCWNSSNKAYTSSGFTAASCTWELSTAYMNFGSDYISKVWRNSYTLSNGKKDYAGRYYYLDGNSATLKAYSTGSTGPWRWVTIENNKVSPSHTKSNGESLLWSESGHCMSVDKATSSPTWQTMDINSYITATSSAPCHWYVGLISTPFQNNNMVY